MTNPRILILLTGDLLNSDEQCTDIATDLIAKLCDIAPVYFSNGNHEIEYKENYGVDIGELYREAGAVVLEKEYQDITVKNQKIRLGGIYGYCLPGKYLETGEADSGGNGVSGGVSGYRSAKDSDVSHAGLLDDQW